MNLISDGNFKGLRKLSILATALVLLILAGLLVLRRESRVDAPEPKHGEYARALPEEKIVRPPPANDAPAPELDPLEKGRKAAPVEKSVAKSDPLASISNPIFASAGEGDGRFTIRDRNVSAWFTDRGVTLAAVFPNDAGPNVLAMNWGLVGAQAVAPRPEGELVTRINRFIGDSSKWQTNLPSYSRIAYDEVMPGVDVTVDSRPHALKYTVRLAAGVDPAVLQFRYDGADAVEVAGDGKSLQVVSALGAMAEGQLEVWQENGGGRIPVAARYEKTGMNEYAIRLDGVNPDLPLTVDPTFSWGTFIGGSQNLTGGDDTGRCIVTDAGNNPWVGGSTQSADFPTSAGVMQRKNLGSGDGFVAKFTLTDGLVWTTFIGGSGSDVVLGIKLDSSNNPVVVGTTSSYNFPTTANSFQPGYTPTSPNTTTGFVAKLDGGTAQLIWSSYLGGSTSTQPQALAIDSNNEIYITGYTDCVNLPGVAGNYQPVYNGSGDAFVMKVKAAGTGIGWATYLGGTGSDFGTCIAVDANFNSYIGGYTNTPTSFPSTGVFMGTAGLNDGFVTKLNPTGTAPVYSRLIGGASTDIIKGIAIDTALPPSVYITGYTYNTGNPVNQWPTNIGPAHGLYYDAFITKVRPAGDLLEWARFLGGNSYDYGYGVTYDATDAMVFVTGTTQSTDFPCTVSGVGPPTTYAAYRNTLSGSSDIFVTRLSTAGVLCYSSYFGGSGSEDGNAVATTLGWFWITGYTNSANFPTTGGAWSTTLSGSSDAYITRLNPFQNGASSLIASTFLGGAHGVSAMNGNFRSMGVDSAGNVAIGGYTTSIDYPTTSGAIRTTNAAGLTKGVVTKLPADGSATSPPMWSTYLGGSNSDYLIGLAMNPAGDVFVTGYTYSSDFPTTGNYRIALTGGEDTFVTRIRADGALLQYSTYLGGATSGDYGYYIAIDSNSNAYVAGEAYSTDFPWTANAVKKILGSPGGQDMFVTKFSSAGALQYSTYLGGDSDAEYPTGLAVDNSGFAYVVGNTYSFDYPIVGGLGTGFDGYAFFVTKLNTNALGYGYSTFIGGSDSEYPTCIAVDSLGSAVIGGYTYSTDYPVTLGAVQTSFHGSTEGFVTKLSVAGNSLDWSTFLGGGSDDYVYSVAIDGTGNVYATGPTRSPDFPMTPPLLNPFYVGSFDVFATRINAGGSTLAWSTFIGGKGDDYSYSISVGPGGNVYVGGITGSPDFPVTGGTFNTTKSGNQDLFVVRINNDPPAPPGSLAQYRSNGTTVIATGGSTNEPSVIMKGISGDPEGDSYKLQVEVRAVGIAFTSPTNIPAFGVDYFEGAFVPAGTTATVTVTGRTNPTQYHWQARSVDASGAASAWLIYGGNPEFIPPSTPAATDFRVDTVPPTLSIGQANPTYTQGTNIGLSGNVGDDVAIFQVQWVNSTNSTSGFATVTAPTWNSGSITLQSGVVNVITVTVTDTAGNTNTATQQISVVQDSTQPTIATSSPTSGSSFTTKNPTVTLAGTTSDLNGVTSMSYQSPNGTFAITPPPFGSWSVANVALNPGVNSITIFATDPAGNTGNKVMSITSDPTPPLLSISTPQASGTYYTNLGTVTLTGTASDTITTVTAVQWQIGGGPLTSASGLASWSTGSIGISNGSNSINIIATDAATNTTTAPLTVFRDPNIPTALDIASNVGPPAWPANPTTIYTKDNSITFLGTASDNPTASSGLLDVKWTNALAGSNGTASGTTSWNTGTIGLLPGSNTITITARDRALNPLSRGVTVVYDNLAPAPIINSPATGSYLTSATTISLGGTVSDAGGSGVASMSWSTTGAVAPSSGTVSFASGSWPSPAGSLVINLAGGVQTITVTATDTAGNSAFTTLTVTRDVTPPLLGITTPAVDPFYTTASTVNLVGTASDASGIQNVTYLVNGTGPFTASGTTSWNANSVPIGVGSNSITITAKDNSNLTTPVTITVIRDNGNPTVAITSPSGSSFVTKNATLAISGTAGDDFKVNSVQWSTGGGFTNATLVAVTPPSSYTWSASIPLSAGLQTVTIRAVDAAGNISSPSPTLSVTLDQTNPQIAFTTPTTLTTFLTSSSQLPAVTPPPAAIAGTATDNIAVAQIEYSLNGAAFVVIAGATSSFIVPTVTLNPGSNTVDIRATDTAGNPFTKTMTVTYDNVPPGVSIVTPQPSGIFYTSGTTVTLSGSALDANGINKIEWRNSHPAPGTYAVIPGATTSWTTPAITLDQLNDNVIDIRATDSAGNTAFTTLTVRYDNTKPTITVTAPPAVTKTTPITISGTSSDAGAGVTGISWTRVEGGASGVVTAPFGIWSTSVPLANGTNTITFTATDGAGNTQAATPVVVVLDTTNPTVTITAPTPNATYYTNQANVNLGGSASDNVALLKLEYQINGGALTAVTPVNPWTLTNVPVSGTTTINLVATDTATNTGSKSITVITDLVAPTISVTPPSPSVVNTTSVIISGSASDALSGIANVTWVRTEGGATGSATYTGPGWSASVPLVAGTNTFTFTANDVAGNSQAAGAVVVTRDNTNPIPVITAPGFPTYATNTATLTTLAGTASDNISLNKVEYQLNNSGTFLATSGTPASWNVPSITLVPGSNTIDVRATDTAGNPGIVTLTVTLDTTKPIVAITTPVLGTLGGPGTYATGTSPVSIGGTASDAVGIQRIDWTNTTNSTSGSTTGTSWSVSIPIVGGPNSISVTAVDTAGNVSVPDTLTVTLDTSAAIVTITTPTTASSFATATTPITIAGNSSHSTGIQKLEWRNNGLPAGWNLIADAGVGFALASSAFSFAPALSVPTNVIEVRATPKTGTASIGTITILYDTTPPTVDITTPTSGPTFVTKTSPILLAGPAGATGVSGLASVVWVNAATAGTQNVTNTSWTASVGLTPGANVITVTAKNGAGTAVSKVLTVTYDLTAPTVNITGPTTNATYQTTAATIALAGTAFDNVALATVQYQVNGGALTGVTPPLTNWTVASIPLPGTGIYVINVIATDTAGNSNTDTLTVTRDIDVPGLTISSPANGSFTNSSPIVVTGTASDNQALASVTWTNAANSTGGTASGTTTWTASGITLAAGPNVITVRATDTLGNFLDKTVTVNYDTTVPVVNIVSPTSGPSWATNTATINLSGTVTDNDQVASVSATNAANNFTVVSGTGAFPNWATNGITLIAGANAITVTATDRSGNTSTKVLTVTLDTTKPTVAVTSPVASGGTYVTGASSLQIGGTAADNLAVQSVGWSNPAAAASGTAAGTSTWVATVPLVSGSNVISFTATDSAGNTSTPAVSITVIRDTSLPSINITVPDPLTTAITKIPSITVSGDAQDSQGMAQVTWSNAATGGSGTATGGSAGGGLNAPWSASIPLAIGVNSITVTAIDTSGNSSIDTVDVTLDIAAPTVSISAPTSGPSWIVQGLSVALGGQTTDNIGLQSVSVTNSALAGTTSANITSGLPAWTIPAVPLAVGTNILTVTSTDKAGNTATAVLTVTSDGTAPSVTITEPTSSPTFYTKVASVSLGGTASDNVGLQKVDWSNTNTGGLGTAIGTSVWAVSIPLGPGSNAISVTSTDTSGRVSAPATITVILDTTAPAIAVTAPSLNLVPNPPTYTTNLGPIAFGGTVTDASGIASVTWSNIATGGSGSATVDTVPVTPTWTASIPVTNGLNGIVFTATDVAGNTTTTSVNATYDTVAPTLSITAPTNQPNYITKATTVALGGTAADNVSIQSIAWVNSANSTSGSAGSSSPWSVASINLAAGDNPIAVTVTDTAGNSTTALIVVRRDINPPLIAITSPVASLGTTVTNISSISVSGTASDDVAVLGVTVNGSPATLGGTWTGVANLVAGSNTITAVATDTAGNTASTTITVILDTTAPTMAVTGHNDGDSFSTVLGTVTLTGTAADPGGALQTVSWTNTTTGGSGTAVGTGSWTAPIALTPGTNIIIITTHDAAGNITQETLTIVHDTQAPTISINSPTAASTYNTTTSPITLGGGAADNVNVASVSWTNASTGVSGGTTGPTTAWSASVPLVEGSNTITVVATDDVGNSTLDTITVTYDPTAPVINITSPTPSPTYSTIQTPLTFAGTASDNLTVASITWSNITAGAVGAASGTTAWTASGIPLISGLNTIVFTVTDGVGNTQTATVTVTYDVTPPTVVITPPVSPTQVRPLILTGTAVDNIGVSTVTWSNSLTGSSGTTTFAAPIWSATIPMIPGLNVVTIKATDALGNLGTASVTVDYSHETVAPALTILSPAPPTFTSPTQLVPISGTATDNVGVTLISWINKTTRVYGIATYSAPNWSTEVPLADGPNVIDITASDDVGNVITQTITITFVASVDTNPPSITITAPTSLDTFDVTSSPLHLEANAIDDIGVVSVTWTNQGTFGSGDSGWGTFWYADIPLAAGVNVITVTATDTSGNQTSDTITVTYNPPVGDPVPPIVSIVTPLATGTFDVSIPSVSVTGTSSDNNKVDTVTLYNSATGVFETASGTTSWSASSMTLNAGVNIITARAVDPAGNIGATTLVVVYTPPAAAKPVAPVIPAGMCGCTGLEPLLVLGALWLGRRWRRRSR